MTVPTEIDSGAPVLAHHEIEIQATLDKVWRLHTLSRRRPHWTPFRSRWCAFPGR